MSNQFDQDEVGSYLDAIEDREGRMESRKGEYMNFCRGERDHIKRIYGEAKENGIPREVLKGLLDDRKDDRRRKKRMEQVSEDLQPLYKDLREVFAAYKEPTQTSFFPDGDDGDGDQQQEEDGDGEQAPFDPDFVNAAEQDEGDKVLNGG